MWATMHRKYNNSHAGISNHETKTKITPNQVTLVSFTLENIPTHARSAIVAIDFKARIQAYYNAKNIP